MAEKGPYHPCLGANLKWWRERAGLTQKRLAKMAGIGKDSVKKYETGASNIDYKSAIKLATTLGIHVRMLWDHHSPPNEGPDPVRVKSDNTP